MIPASPPLLSSSASPTHNTSPGDPETRSPPPTTPAQLILNPNRLRFGLEVPQRYTRENGANCLYFYDISNPVAKHLGIEEGGLSWVLDANPDDYLTKPLLWTVVKAAILHVVTTADVPSTTASAKIPPSRDRDVSELENLRWGDCIDFGRYRGCGIWFIGGPRWDESKWRLLKTYGEMGYARPLEFCDCPPKYYERLFARGIGVYQELFDLGRLWGLPKERAKAFWNRIEEVRASPDAYVSQGDFDYRVKSVDVSCFPKGTWGLLEHSGEVSEETKLQILQLLERQFVFSDSRSDHALFVESYERRRRRVRWDSLVILAFTLRHVLPWDLCRVIVEFVV